MAKGEWKINSLVLLFSSRFYFDLFTFHLFTFAIEHVIARNRSNLPSSIHS
jgi:hypothetical protein